jgi:hypothetical protein
MWDVLKSEVVTVQQWERIGLWDEQGKTGRGAEGVKQSQRERGSAQEEKRTCDRQLMDSEYEVSGENVR